AYGRPRRLYRSAMAAYPGRRGSRPAIARGMGRRGWMRPAGPANARALCGRPQARGKFLFGGDEKLYIRGVTYGTFRPGDSGGEFNPITAAADFVEMSMNGINAVRTYTVPPRWLLDLAWEHGLRVMVGVPWEQHVAFLNERARARSIEDRVRAAVRSCAG